MEVSLKSSQSRHFAKIISSTCQNNLQKYKELKRLKLFAMHAKKTRESLVGKENFFRKISCQIDKKLT
ncbi:hypothetical protein EUGRSUZ_C03718 [Eucalyptus grandis]|uniref:Uncharacterized protein n=2 Tax=Eucalyptus grandis TaxID=71139 RepID=A0ACC3LJN7_EUCGR|nr:hypothetical protein EUGRSUZ_C03718 [Eucalyptus grandis]